MGFDKNLFEEPYELEAMAELSEPVFKSDGIDFRQTPYRTSSLWGYKKGIDYFCRIARLFKVEMGYKITLLGKQGVFDSTFKVLHTDYYDEFKRDNDLSDALARHIKEIEAQPYIFDTMKEKYPFVNDVKGRFDDVEMSIPEICGLIGKLRKHRIEFYSRLLQEYISQKDQYNQRLRKNLQDKNNNALKEEIKTTAQALKADRLEVDNNLKSLSFEPEFESADINNSIISESTYNFFVTSWKLKDLLEVGVSGIDRHYLLDEELSQYRAKVIWEPKRAIDHLFLIFTIFRTEMDYILTSDLDKNQFEKTLRVLIRDFSSEFAEKGDLEGALDRYIEELERYTFFSFEKRELYDLISQILIDLRRYKIIFYEAILQEYWKNKAQYDAKFTRYFSIEKAKKAYKKKKNEKYSKIDTDIKKVREEGTGNTFRSAKECNDKREDLSSGLVAEELKPIRVKSHNWVSVLHKKLYHHSFKGDKEEAINTGRLLIKRDPEDGSLHSLFGEVLTEFGEYEEAIIVLQKALALEPLGWFIHDTYYHLAKCYIGLRDFGLARESLDKGDIASKKRYFSMEMMREWKEKKQKILAEIDDLK